MDIMFKIHIPEWQGPLRETPVEFPVMVTLEQARALRDELEEGFAQVKED